MRYSSRWLFILLTVASVHLAEAQQPKRVHRLGYLGSGDSAADAGRAEGIRLSLRGLGYIEGQNIVIEYRYAEGNFDRLPELAADLVRLKVDLIIVAGGAAPIRAAVNSTKTIPIVLVGAGSDPVRAGYIKDLARPGGNVTGITSLGRDLGGKRLELLKEIVPKLAEVAFLYDGHNADSIRELKEILPVPARTLGLVIQPLEARDKDDFEKIFADLNKRRANGLYVPGGGPLIGANRKRIATFALKTRLPSVYGNRETVEMGGLMSYAADQVDSYRRVAIYVDKVLKGGNPGEIPIEQPTKFELAINLRTAKQIGLVIPPNVLARADRVIK